VKKFQGHNEIQGRIVSNTVHPISSCPFLQGLKKYPVGQDRRSVLQKTKEGSEKRALSPLELFFIVIRAPGKPPPDQEYKKDRSGYNHHGHGNTRYTVYQGQFPD
jgi:hypothetical protein